MSERAMKVAREIMSTPAQYYLRATNGVWYVETEVLELKIGAALDAFQPEWLDISTAPKDGTEILLWDPDNRVESRLQIGQWNDIWSTPGWQSNMENETIRRPTRWQPLPAPPRKDATDE